MIRSKIASRFKRAKTMGFLWALLAFALHVVPGAIGPAHAQGTRKDDIVFNSRGIPLAGATVRVCAMPASGQPCTPLALIYSDVALTQALANPTTTDGLGNYFFYAAPGKYEIEISGPAITTKQIPNVVLPNDPASPTFSGAVSAFSLTLSGNLTVNGNTTVVGNLASGTLNLANQSTPPGSAGSGTVSLYTKTADKRLYYKDDTGTEVGPLGSGAQTTAVNTFTASQNMDSGLHIKGPDPYSDMARFGGYFNSASPATTASCTNASTSVTLAAALDFQDATKFPGTNIGNGIVLYQCAGAHSGAIRRDERYDHLQLSLRRRGFAGRPHCRVARRLDQHWRRDSRHQFRHPHQRHLEQHSQRRASLHLLRELQRLRQRAHQHRWLHRQRPLQRQFHCHCHAHFFDLHRLLAFRHYAQRDQRLQRRHHESARLQHPLDGFRGRPQHRGRLQQRHGDALVGLPQQRAGIRRPGPRSLLRRLWREYPGRKHSLVRALFARKRGEQIPGHHHRVRRWNHQHRGRQRGRQHHQRPNGAARQFAEPPCRNDGFSQHHSRLHSRRRQSSFQRRDGLYQHQCRQRTHPHGGTFHQSALGGARRRFRPRGPAQQHHFLPVRQPGHAYGRRQRLSRPSPTALQQRHSQRRQSANAHRRELCEHRIQCHRCPANCLRQRSGLYVRASLRQRGLRRLDEHRQRKYSRRGHQRPDPFGHRRSRQRKFLRRNPGDPRPAVHPLHHPVRGHDHHRRFHPRAIRNQRLEHARRDQLSIRRSSLAEQRRLDQQHHRRFQRQDDQVPWRTALRPLHSRGRPVWYFAPAQAGGRRRPQCPARKWFH